MDTTFDTTRNHDTGPAKPAMIAAPLAMIDVYLSRPFQARRLHRETRRSASPYGADFTRLGGPPVYDGTVLDELRQVLKPASIARALELFEMQIDRVVAVCIAPTRHALALEVHGLSGSAGMLGFMELGDASRALQSALGTESVDCSRSEEALDAFVGALRRAIRVLVELRAAERANITE